MSRLFWIENAIEEIDEILEEEHGERFDYRPLDHDTTDKEKLLNARARLDSVRREVEIVDKLRHEHEYRRHIKDSQIYMGGSNNPSGLPRIEMKHGRTNVPSNIQDLVEDHDCKLFESSYNPRFRISCGWEGRGPLFETDKEFVGEVSKRKDT